MYEIFWLVHPIGTKKCGRIRMLPAVRRDVMTHGWNERLGSFTQAYDNAALDSSLRLVEPYGFLAADDERYRRTVKCVERSLMHKD